MAQDVRSKVILGIDVNEFRRGISQVDASIKRISGQFQNLGGLIGASFAVSKLQEFGTEALRLGSKLEKASAGFARFGTEADLNKLRQQTRGLVSDLELMQQTVKGANLGIPFKDMGVLLEFAKRRADETGESLENLIGSIIEGIGRKSTRRLDNLGISADRLKEKVGGISLEMANVADVSRAMVDIANEELAKMGPAAETATDSVDRLSVSWANLKAEIGKDIAPAVTTAVSGLEEFWRATVALYQGRYFKDVIRPILEGNVMPTMPGVPNATVPTDPNAPKGPVKQAAPFGVYAPAPETIASLRENAKALRDQYEAVKINSPEFFRLRKEADALDERIKTLTGNVKEAKTAFIDVVGEMQRMYQLEKQFLLQDWVPFDTTELKAATDEANDELVPLLDEVAQKFDNIALVAQQFGNMLTASFQAALVSGEDFFETLGKALKAYLQQLIATVAATAALAVVSSAFGGGTFLTAFAKVGQGTGLAGFFGGNEEFVGRVKGFELLLQQNRTNRNSSLLTGGN